jgi:hypothetical protein
MILSSAGNLGLGVTPSAWGTANTERALQLNGGSLWSFSTFGLGLINNAFYNSSGNYIYSRNGFALDYFQSSSNGAHIWRTAASGTAGNAISFTQAMTLDASGRLGIGTTLPDNLITIGTSSANHGIALKQSSITVGRFAVTNPGVDNNPYIGSVANNDFYFITNNTERARIDTSGNFGLGAAPSAWGAGSKALQINSNLSLWSASSTNNYVYANAYYDGTNDKYVSTAEAARIRFAGATTIFNYAASGSANANITWQESFRTDTSGNLLVGTTSALNGTARLDVSAPSGNNLATTLKNDAGAGQWNTQIWNAGTTGDNALIQFATETSYTGRGSISYNRAGGLVAYNTTSDYRAKDISGPVINSGALIDSVPVYMGKMKDATQERPMFIAHETPAYAHTGEKDAVDKDGNPIYQQMDASALIPVMWAEIQSLRQRLSAANL